jgi:uncharacterized sporulation protein YeaH/YhbH (DUF444 family)
MQNLPEAMIPSLERPTLVPVIAIRPRAQKKLAIHSEDLETSDVAHSDSDKSDIVGQGSKRTLQGSPNRREAPSKRSRTIGKGKAAIATSNIDLGEFVFDEDTTIDADLVPRVVGKVSGSLLSRDYRADGW